MKHIRNLVLGSEGFVGIPFCRYLERIGEEVVRLDIKRGNEEDLRYMALPLDNIDRVYFLAWEVGGSKYLYLDNSQEIQLDWNVKMLLNVMPQLHDVPFLFISSQLAEDVNSVYGVTKRLGEVWTKVLKGSCVRLWNIYGSHEDPNIRSHVIGDFIYQALNNGEIKMLTTGEEKRQFVHYEDANRAFRKALSYPLQGTYDVTSNEWVKIIDIANMIGVMTGAKVYPGDKIGSTQFTQTVNLIPGWWSDEISLEDGLSDQVNYARKLWKK